MVRMDRDGLPGGGEAIGHLQAAAREMVAAARAFLDAVEEVVEDDQRLGRVVGGVTDLLQQAGDAVSHLGRSEPPPGERKVRHIVVE